MNIISKPIAELIPAPYNPRKNLTEKDMPYRKLRASLERFGLVEPLLWNNRTKHLVSGHQRLNILKAARTEQIPVVVVDLPLDEEQALNIVLNNRQAQGDWDIDKLQTLMGALTSEETTAATGFSSTEIQELQSDLEPAEDEWHEQDAKGQTEIIFRLKTEQFELLRPVFDAFTQEHGLQPHIRQV